jgi:uncharacterized protein YjdB
MKKTSKQFGLIALVVLTGLITSGCLSLFFSGVTIRSEGNLSSVRAGGTLRLSASGQGIIWTVSSTIDSAGPVADGTSISPNGVLTVSPYETSIILYVIATSAKNEESAYKPIRVVTVTGVNVNSQSQSVTCGRTLQFSASVTGNNNPDNFVTWRVSSNAAGTGAVSSGTNINANGLLTVAINETVTALYITATSMVDPSKSGSAAVTVLIPTVTNVIVSPSNQSVTRGRTLQFSASVIGTNDPVNTVIWSVSSNAAGTGVVTPGTGINSNGLLTVSANESLTTLYVIAVSIVDQSKSGSAVVAVIIPIVTGVTVSPSNQSVTSGGTIQFYASVTGTNNPDSSVTWRVSSNAAGTGAVSSGTNINANGLLTVAVNETATILYIFATSVEDASKFGSIAVTIIIPTVTGVTVSPSNQSVTRGGMIQFSASITGTNNPVNAVTWRVSSNAAGNGAVTPGTVINANGLLTVSANETMTTLYIIAASAVDPTKSGGVAVNVIIPAAPTITGVTVSPSGQSVTRGGTMQFSASITGTNNPVNAVTWRVSSNAAGTGAVTSGTVINANGLLMVSANETMTTLYVIAASAVDPTKSGSVVVNVIIPAAPTVTGVTVSPSNQSVTRGGTIQFNASVTGTNNPSGSVTWRVSSNAAGNGAVTQGTVINANGLLTISANETTATLYIIATSTADPTKSGSVAVNVIIPATPTVTGVTVSPSGQSVERGRTIQFNASVTGTNNPSGSVTWRVSSNAAGTGSVTSGTSINASGLLTISANETMTILYIIATSTADTSKSGSAAVTVIIPATPTVTGVTVGPSGQSVQRGRPLQLSATVTGTNNPVNTVTWRVSTTPDGSGGVANGTTINPNGRLTVSANETAAVLYVIATSTADPSKSGSVAVSVIHGNSGNQNNQGNQDNQGNQGNRGNQGNQNQQ